MTPKLTPEQCEAVDRASGPVALEDTRTHRTYYLVDENTLADLQHQQNIAAVREGVADMEAGRVISLDELDARIQQRLGLDSK